MPDISNKKRPAKVIIANKIFLVEIDFSKYCFEIRDCDQEFIDYSVDTKFSAFFNIGDFWCKLSGVRLVSYSPQVVKFRWEYSNPIEISEIRMLKIMLLLDNSPVKQNVDS